MSINRRTFIGAAIATLTTSPLFADLAPRRAKPHRRKGGEAFPPLPLPATPLRRTEKKRPPAPPVLFNRVKYGSTRKIEYNGEMVDFADWNTDPNCLRSLCKKSRRRLGVAYRDISAPLKKMDGDPAQLPIAFLTGHKTLPFNDAEKTMLRNFIQKGGYLWCEACCGAPEFVRNSGALAKELFPKGSVKRLPTDHPVYRSFYDIQKVDYSPAAAKEEPDGLPALFGLDLADRTAIMISPYDLSCGWDDHTHKGKLAYGVKDANRLGVNMVAYALAYHKLGIFLSKNKVYFQDSEPSRGDFIFAQLKHEGAWDTDPSAAANLLKAVKASGGTRVKFKRVSIDLKSAELFAYPFIYITGHDTFSWTDAEIKKIRSYISNGGFLLADACCGREAFGAAFRSNMKKVFPKKPLEKLKPDHALFSARYKIGAVKYTPYLSKLKPALKSPALSGITFDGATRVIFSKYDLGNGWEGVDHPFTCGYSAQDALRLGINIVYYALTH